MVIKQERYKDFFLCIMAVICAAAVIGCGTKTVKSTDIVMEIAGQPVIKAEYQMILDGFESEVKRQYTTDEANQKDFWRNEWEDKNPLDQIMQLAKEDLIYKKVIAQLAKEAGIEIETDFRSIAAQMEDQNKEREGKIDSGEVVYGLKSFEIKDYYNYIYTQAEYEVIENMKKNLDISQEALREIYQENIEQYTCEVSVRILAAEMPADEGMDLAKQAAGAMAQETDMEALAVMYPSVHFYEIDLSSLNTESGKSGAYYQRWLIASEMDPGEVCEPFYIGENIMALRCLERNEQEAVPFEEVEGILESDSKTSLIKEEIGKKTEAAEISFDDKVLEQAALEALEE